MKEYKTEKEFLDSYNKNDFDLLSVTADILVLSVSSYESDNYRKTDEKHMSVLLVKRDDYPFKNKWCFPGGFVGYDEDLDKAPARILKNETNLSDIYLEQLYTYGDPKRDPRMRIISTAYMALIDKNRLDCKLNESASWFDVKILDDGKIVDVFLNNGETEIKVKIEKILRDKTTDRYDFKVIENKDLAFDHAKVLLSGIERLRNKVNYTDIVFNMMPEYFTLGELQSVYEVILNKKLLDPAFRRIIEPKVQKTDKMRTGEGHRPSVLFKYKK
ncbi:MAG: NUDIX hydrolase [Erysipelotrichales bacterium]|nr:NUDIX hydrolase [Erysipelotrichales bacterium]